MADMIDEAVGNTRNTRSNQIDTTQKSSSIIDNKGMLDLQKFIEGYKELASELKKTFKEAEHSTELAWETAEKIAKEAQSISHSVKDYNTEKTARNSSYKQAIADAKKDDDYATAGKLKQKQEKEDKESEKKFRKEQTEAMKGNMSDIAKGIFTFNKESLIDGFKGLSQNLKDTYGSTGKGVAAVAMTGLVKGLDKAVSALGDFTDALRSQIKAIGGYKTAWDTRLYGSTKGHTSISDFVKNNVAVSPYIKQESVMQKLNNAIEQGINYNVEQRAFLDVLSDNIATTFDSFDATLRDLVRVQQADSTAYRLGMEASLTEYLNRMFESTEYLSGLSDTVTANLYQATSLLDATKAIGYEYQVQKWLGSMYSVGMSQGAIQNISDALGKMLSGDISGTDSGAGKLLVMSAANSGLDYAKLLTDGINESDVNLLLGAMVDYLQQIASDNKVVQSQMAGIFGLQTADIQAAKNLKGYISSIYDMDKNYSAATAGGKLYSMVDTMGSRVSMGQLLENITDNFKYTLAEGIAADPALYSILTIGDLLDQTVGGIKIPTVSVFGNSVDLNATVSDLLKMGALSGSMIKGLGAVFSGLGQLGEGFRGAFNNFMSAGSAKVAVGSGFGITSKENDSSLLSMNYVGQGSSDAYVAANDALIEDSKNEAKTSNTTMPEDDSEKSPTLEGQNRIIEMLSYILNDGQDYINVNVNNMPSLDTVNEWIRTH